MDKAALINELMHHTWVMLKPSAIEGVGVFAITDIKKGQRNIFSNDTSEWIKISKAELATLPPHSRFVVENYCLYDAEHYFVPEYGFKMVDLVVFLNHADIPNIASINEGADFIALQDIMAGEELVIDYGEIVEDS